MEEAVILNQFIYWSKRTKYTDQYVAEEKKRIKENDESVDLVSSTGWIYKTAEELADETMLSISVTTLRKHIKNLVDKGYLPRRNNPKYKWDKTFQYRPDSVKIMLDLQKIGFVKVKK